MRIALILHYIFIIIVIVKKYWILTFAYDIIYVKSCIYIK